MKALAITFVCLSIGFTAACGGGGSSSTQTSTTTTTQSFPSISGNYDLTAVSQAAVNTSFIGGSLSSDTTGHVTGVVHIDNSSCYALTTDVPITGTVTSQGQLSVTTASVNSQSVAVTATISSDGSTVSTGTYTITGGCAGGDHGTINGFRMQPFTGTYTGNFTSNSGGTPVAVTAPLTQSSTADAHGFFQLSGTASLANSVCFSSATVVNSAAAGEAMILILTANTGATVNFVGLATDSTAKTINGNYSISGGVCSGDSGQGTISHP